MTLWKISYTILHGEYEYADSLSCEADNLSMTAAAAAIAEACCGGDDVEQNEFIASLVREGYMVLPDGRTITDLGWEQVSPIVITISDGCIEAITRIPEGVTVEIRDWDGAFEDETGEWVPAVSEWEGPL
jgi:hypothetical protein